MLELKLSFVPLLKVFIFFGQKRAGRNKRYLGVSFFKRDIFSMWDKIRSKYFRSHLSGLSSIVYLMTALTDDVLSFGDVIHYI